MSDKRSVATDALETLGTIIDDKQKRDAIHLAVMPVIAGVVLPPGMHVSATNGVAMPAVPGEGLGIVDPFLMVPPKDYVLLRGVNVTGTPTYTITQQVEDLL